MTTHTPPTYDDRIAELREKVCGPDDSLVAELLALASELAEKLSVAEAQTLTRCMRCERWFQHATEHWPATPPYAVCPRCHVKEIQSGLDVERAAHAETKRELERLQALDIRSAKLADMQLHLDSKATRLMQLEERLIWPSDNSDTPWDAWYRTLRDTVIEALGTASLPTCDQIVDHIHGIKRELERERTRREAAEAQAREHFPFQDVHGKFCCGPTLAEAHHGQCKGTGRKAKAGEPT